MPNLHKLTEDIGGLFKTHAERLFRASFFVKIVFVLGATLIAGVAEAIEIAHGISALTVIVLAGITVAFVGGVYAAMTEPDVSRTLETARQAIEEARLRERQMDRFNADRARLAREVDRGLELYNSMDVMRGAIEQSLTLPQVPPVATIIQTCLDAAENSLLVAFDFDIRDTWTIGIFVAERRSESDKVTLRCIAHSRKIRCDISQARTWVEGVGVAGVAYSMSNEIILRDMLAPQLGTVFDLGTLARPYDSKRYRSIAAIPIRVGASATPWGIAVATSDQPGHFSPEASDGVSTAEPIRAIAAMAALAVVATAAHNQNVLSTPQQNSPTLAPRTGDETTGEGPAFEN
jgi:hypothetical protein